MPVPRNVSGVLDAINKATGKKTTKATLTPKSEEEEHSIKTTVGRDEASLRRRARKAEEALALMTAERDVLKAETDTLRVAAKKWNDFEHVEKSKLMDLIPTELRKDAKDMPLHHLRMFVKGKEATATAKAEESKVDPTDIFALQKSGDKEGMLKYAKGVKDGTIVPTLPKPEVAKT